MTVATELQALYQQNGGLKPEIVVRWARLHRRSALHRRFQWDNTKAAQEYRLWQARNLITEVRVVYPDRKMRQVYVSPVQNRKGDRATGYEALVDVLNNARKRARFLSQALAEYERINEKYVDLTELADVFAAIRRARRDNTRRE